MTTLRSIYCFLLLAGACPPAEGQYFSRRYDTYGFDLSQEAFDVELLGDSGYMVFSAGEDVDSNFNFHSVTATRLDLVGQVMGETRVNWPWKSLLAGWANAADKTLDGGYIFLGGGMDTSGSVFSHMIRFDAEGDSLWVRSYSTPGADWVGRQASVAHDGGFVLVGETGSGGGLSAFLIKSDAQGNQQWVQTYGGPYNDFLATVDTVPDGGFYLGGNYRVVQDNLDFWVMRTDSLGAVIWQQTWGSVFDEPNAHLTALSDGHILVASALATQPGYAGMLPYLAKLDSADGTPIWERTYGTPEFNTTFFVGKPLSNDGIIAAGQNYSPGYRQGMLLRTNAQGDSLWMRFYAYADSLMNDGKGKFFDVIPTSDNGFIAVGTVYNSASGNNPPGYTQDVWVVKVDSMGCLVPGCDGIGMINSQITNLRDALSVAPNPASTAAQLTWQLPSHLAKGKAQLSVVSISGSVHRTEQLDLSRGAHKLDVQGLAPGVYYLHVVSDGTWVTGGKLVVE